MSKKKTWPVIEAEECKGCGRCTKACPKSVLVMGKKLNRLGFATVYYTGSGCIGCGACFYNCPEPSAITVVEQCESEGSKKQ